MGDRLSGQTVVITGGGRGYGEFMGVAVAREGANVVLTARTLSECEGVVARIRGKGGEALPLQCDVASEADIQAMADATIAAYGKIDVLVNNAGHPGSVEAFADISAADWGDTFDVNVKGMFMGAKAVLPAMIERGDGHIINVTSWTAQPGFPFVRSIPYTVSKFAVDGMTYVVSLKLKDTGVRFNAFSPGLAETRFLSGMPPGYLTGREVQTPEHVMEPIVHMLTSPDIGNGVIFDVLGWLREQGLYDQYSFIHD